MWSDRTKIALEKKYLEIKKIGDTFLLFICKTSIFIVMQKFK